MTIKTVKFSCFLVPVELIHAYGLKAVKIQPTCSDEIFDGEGLCSFARAFINTACAEEHASAFILTTKCDQMRRSPDVIALHNKVRVFLMTVPATREKAAEQLYISELKRLGLFLEQIGGSRPSNEKLFQTILEYSKTNSCPQKNSIGGNDGIALAVIGGELRKEDLKIHNLITQASGRIVLNATDSNLSAVARSINVEKCKSDPIAELAKSYLGIPRISSRPNDNFYDYLLSEIEKRGIKGVISLRHQWCDLWHGEIRRLRDCLAAPLLDIQLEGNDCDTSHLFNRIQAFLEMLN